MSVKFFCNNCGKEIPEMDTGEVKTALTISQVEEACICLDCGEAQQKQELIRQRATEAQKKLSEFDADMWPRRKQLVDELNAIIAECLHPNMVPDNFQGGEIVCPDCGQSAEIK